MQHDTNGNLLWVAVLGGNSTDSAQDVTVAPDGTVVTGGGFSLFYQTDSVYFGLAGASSPLTASGYGQGDAFVAKCSAAGVFAWAATLGSGYEDIVNAVDTDSSGNVIAGGMFGGGSVGAGAAPVSYNGVAVPALTGMGGYDGFVIKTDASGNLLWAVQIGGASDDSITAVAADAAGNIYASGSCASASCSFGGAAGFANNDQTGLTTDAFLVKLSPTGAVLWSTVVSGTLNDMGTGVAVDTTSATGNVYLSGTFASPSIAVGTAANAPVIPNMGSSTPASDGYIAALSPSGAVLWTLHLTGTGAAEALDVNSAAGQLFVASSFTNSLAIFGGYSIAESPTSAKATMFFARVNAAGVVTMLMPIGSDYTGSIATSADGSTVLIAGMLAGSSTYPTAMYGDLFSGGPQVNLTTNGAYDAVLLSLNVTTASVNTPLTSSPASGAIVYVASPPTPPGPKFGGLHNISGGGGLAGIVIGSCIFGLILGAGVIKCASSSSKPEQRSSKMDFIQHGEPEASKPAAPAPASEAPAPPPPQRDVEQAVPTEAEHA